MGFDHIQHPRAAERAALLPIALLLAVWSGACRQRVLDQPRLVLDRETYDLGAISQGPAERAIRLANGGDAPLVVGAVVPSRFCSALALPEPVVPGGTASLKVVCRPDVDGAMKEQLRIESNDPAGARTVDLIATVQPILGFDAEIFRENLSFGETRSREVHVIGPLAREARLVLPEVDASVLRVETLPGGVRLHCTGKRSGFHSGTLAFRTGLQRPALVGLPWACKVAGTMELSPTNPFINLKVDGPKQVAIDVRSTQPGFEVKAARVTQGPFGATVERVGPGAYRVVVRAVESRLPSSARGVNGTLVLETNDRTDLRREVPLLAVGRIPL